MYARNRDLIDDSCQATDLLHGVQDELLFVKTAGLTLESHDSFIHTHSQAVDRTLASPT